MSRRFITTIGLCFIVFGLAKCGQTSNENKSQTKEKEAPQMYEQSELAALMHEVHDLSAEWKTQLENGDPLTPIPEWMSEILSATATNPAELENGAFIPLAEEYIRKLERLANADESGRVDAFNESIQTCISCHKIYCNGPIPKIKKLKI